MFCCVCLRTLKYSVLCSTFFDVRICVLCFFVSNNDKCDALLSTHFITLIIKRMLLNASTNATTTEKHYEINDILLKL